jgi:hypothetical protein
MVVCASQFPSGKSVKNPDTPAGHRPAVGVGALWPCRSEARASSFDSQSLRTGSTAGTDNRRML